MEGWNKDGKGMDMVDTNTKLILQHSSPLIAEATQHLFPSDFSVSIHFTKDETAN